MLTKSLIRCLLTLICFSTGLIGASAENLFPEISVNGRSAYIIPEAAAASEMARMFGQNPNPKITGYWTPTAKEIEAADQAICAFIHKATFNGAIAFPDVVKAPEKFVPDAVGKGTYEIGRIDKNIKSYRVQFVGLIWNGKKQLFANYFEWRDWLKEVDPAKVLIVVNDGGYHFWQIQYNVETASCENLQINGPWASDH